MPLAVDNLPRPDKENNVPEVLPLEPLAQGNINGDSGASIPVNMEDGDVRLLPAIDEKGALLTTDEALERYRQTGLHYGLFESEEQARQFRQQNIGQDGREKIRAALLLSRGISADQIAKDKQIARNLGISPEAVRYDREDAEDEDIARRLDKFDGLVEYASRSDAHAALVRADPSLPDVAGLVREFDDIFYNPDAIKRRNEKVIRESGADGYIKEARPLSLAGQKAAFEIGLQQKYEAELGNLWAAGVDISEREKALEEKYALLREQSVTGSYFDEWWGLNTAIQQIPLNLPIQAKSATVGLMAATVAGLGAGVSSAGIGALPAAQMAFTPAYLAETAIETYKVERGSQIMAMRRMRDADGNPLPRDVIIAASSIYAALSAGVEVGGEAVFLKMLKPFGLTGKASKQAISGAIQRAASNKKVWATLLDIGKRIGIVTVSEGIEEGVQEGLAILSESAAGAVANNRSGANFNTDIFTSENGSRIMVAIQGGMAGGFWMGSGPIVMSGAMRAANAKKAREFAEGQIKLHAAIEKSATYQRDPEAMSEILQASSPTMREEVSLPVDAMLEQRERGIDLLTPLGISQETAEKAAALGQSLQVELGRLHSLLDSKQFNAAAEIMQRNDLNVSSQDNQSSDADMDMVLLQALENDAASEDARKGTSLLSEDEKSELDKAHAALRSEMLEAVKAIPGLASQLQAQGGASVYIDSILKLWRKRAIIAARHANENPADVYRRTVMGGFRQMEMKAAQETVEKDIANDLGNQGEAAKAEAASKPEPIIHNGVETLDDLYKLAREAQGGFSEVISDIATGTGGEAHFRPGDGLKRPERVQRKIDQDYPNDGAKRVLDVLGATLLYDSRKDVEAALTEIKKKIEGMGGSVIRVKNRFEKPSSGYKDFLFNIRMPNGFVTELLMTTKAMSEAKMGETGIGHDIYEAMQEADGIINNENTTPEDRIAAQYIRSILEIASKKYYDSTGAQSNATASLSEIVEPLQRISAPEDENLSSNVYPKLVSLLETMRQRLPSVANTNGISSYSINLSTNTVPPSGNVSTLDATGNVTPEALTNFASTGDVSGVSDEGITEPPVDSENISQSENSGKDAFDGKIIGQETTILGKGNPEPARYEVWELDDIIPSHDPENNFARREDYPAQAQERPYHSDAGEQEKVRGNALTYQPAFVLNTDPTAGNGPPIITSDGIVLGGNSRTMTLQLVYANNEKGATEYRAMLANTAPWFGIDPANLEQMSRPVLVRVVDSNLALDEMAVKSRLYNQTTTQKLQAKAEGVSRARLLSAGTIDMLAENMADFDTLRQFLDSSKARQFIRALRADGVIEKTEISSLTDNAGKLNDSGKKLVEDALRGLVIPDYDVLSNTPQAVLNKLDRVIPSLARLKARGEGWDLSNVLMPALRFLGNASIEGKDISTWLGQADLMEPDPDKKRPAVQALALTFGNATQKEIAARFGVFTAHAESQPRSTGLLSGIEGTSPAKAFIQAFLQPVVSIDGKNIANFNPEGNFAHAALLWAARHGGKTKSVSVAQNALQKKMTGKKSSPEEKAEAREMLAALAEYSGSVGIYEPKLGQFFNYKPGQELFQTAWHGSPYRFEKFSLTGIGSGEGAQVHGWGLYFAANKDVSENYRETLAGTRYFSGERELEGDEAWAASFLFDEDGKRVPLEEAISLAKQKLKAGEKRDNVIEKMRQLDNDNLRFDEGQLYEVEIPEEYEMIDEQKPLREQSVYVLNALGSIESWPYAGLAKNLATLYEKAEASTGKAGVEKVKAFLRKLFVLTESEIDTMSDNDFDDIVFAFNNNDEMLGLAVSVGMDLRHGEIHSGKDIYNDFMHRLYSPEKASKLLNEHGIKGISYVGGRDGRCFVIFDDQDIQITDTYYQNENPIEVSSEELGVPAGADIKEFINAAKKYHDQLKYESEHGKPVIQPELNKPVRFSKKGWEKNRFAGARKAKWSLFPYLREIIETSKILHSEKIVGKVGFSKAHFAVNKVRIDGNEFTVGLTFLEDSKGNLFYNIVDDINETRIGKALQGVTAEQTLGHEELLQDETSSGGNTINNQPDDVNLIILGKSSADGARGSVARHGSEYFIKLFQEADMSTLIHEMGHVYFLELERMISQGIADQEMIDDFKKLRKWVGAQDGTRLTNSQHEQLARAWEAYLMEGKAPSLELESVFARFRRWLMRIYRQVKNLNIALNDEVRGVFDRMLATEDEIAMAAAENGIIDLTTGELDAMGVSKVQQQHTRKLMASILEQAESRLRKARDQERRSRLTDYAAIAENELQEDPLWIATAEAKETPLDAHYAAYILGDVAFEALQKRHPDILAVNGDDAEIFAAKRGFASAQAMFAQMTDMPSKRNAIRARVIELNAEYDRQFDAVETLFGTEALQEHASLVARQLSRIGKRKYIQQQAVSRVASAELNKMSLEVALQAHVFRNNVQNALRQERKAIAAKDWAKALNANSKARINIELARQSQALRRESDSMKRKVSAFMRSKRAPGIAKYFLNTLAAQHGVIGANARLQKTYKPEEILEWQQELKDEGFELLIDEGIMTTSKTWQKMSVDEFRELMNAFNQIIITERNQRKLLTAQKKQDFSEACDAISKSVATHGHRQPHRTVEQDSLLKRRLKNFHVSHMKIEELCLQMDGGKPGPCWTYIYKPIADAENEQSTRLRNARNYLRKNIFSMFSAKEWSQMGRKKEYVPEIGESMTMENRIGLALNMGNEINIDRIKTGHHWFDKEVAAILAPLGRREWEFVQAVWDYFETFKDEAFKLQEDITGIRPEMVEAQPFVVTLADGSQMKLRGGYYPISYNPAFSEKKFEWKQKEMDKGLLGGRNYGKAMTKHGHLEARGPVGLKSPLLLEMSVIAEHVYNVIHDLSYRKPVIDVARIIRNKKVQGHICEFVGRDEYRELMPWLQDVANEFQDSMGTIQRMLSWARASSTIMQMGFKFTTMIQQPLGILQTIDVLGARWTARGIYITYKDVRRLPELYRQTCEMSPMMAARLESYDREIRDIAKSLRKSSLFGWVDELRKKAFLPMGYMQMGVDLPTWWGAYEKSMAENHGDEKAAIQYADSIVRQSQGSGMTKDLARIQRGPEGYRLFTMFYSYFNVLYNLGARHIKELKRDHSPSGIYRAATAALWLWFLPAVLGDLVVARGPDEDEEWWKWLLAKWSAYPLQSMVDVRDVAGSIASGFDYELSPAANTPESMVKAFRAIQKALEAEDVSKVVKPLAEATGYALGLPLKQPIITMGNMWDYATDPASEFYVRDLFYVKPKERRVREGR